MILTTPNGRTVNTGLLHRISDEPNAYGNHLYAVPLYEGAALIDHVNVRARNWADALDALQRMYQRSNA